MSRFIRRSAMALPVLLIAPVTAAAVALPAQAATWSAALPLPVGVGSQGFAENASGMQVAASTTGSQGESSVVVASSANGVTWSAPLTIDAGENPAVAIAPSGRAVAAWEGGPATAPVIQASVLPPGGTWSAPVNVSTDAFGGPVIGMDGSGNAIVAWTGGGKQIRTASLPAGGSWTAVDTLDPAVDGFALGLAVNSAGSAIITWAEPAPHHHGRLRLDPGRLQRARHPLGARGTWSTPLGLPLPGPSSSANPTTRPRSTARVTSSPSTSRGLR